MDARVERYEHYFLPSYLTFSVMNTYTFHAKYEDALHLMLPKCYSLFIFQLIILKHHHHLNSTHSFVTIC